VTPVGVGPGVAAAAAAEGDGRTVAVQPERIAASITQTVIRAAALFTR
jgi:hypothetical protein